VYSLSIKPRAILMAKEAYDWYEEQRKGLGEEFLAELDLFYKKIVSTPTHYKKVKKNYRQVSLDRYPFIIFYELFQKEVVVFAVFHTKRSPQKIFRN
jgi:toxin ParE1/3/4